MNPTFSHLTGALVFHFFHFTYCDNPHCDFGTFSTCKGANEACDEATSTCICRKGYLRNSENMCSKVVPNKSSNGATIAIVVIITLALICGGLYMIIKRYRLVDYVRHRISFRRSTDVQYEDVMIDRQDDLPIST